MRFPDENGTIFKFNFTGRVQDAVTEPEKKIFFDANKRIVLEPGEVSTLRLQELKDDGYKVIKLANEEDFKGYGEFDCKILGLIPIRKSTTYVPYVMSASIPLK